MKLRRMWLLLLLSGAGNAARLEIVEAVAGPQATAVVAVRLSTEGAPISSLQFDLQYPKNILMVSVAPGTAVRESHKQLYLQEAAAGTKRIVLAGLNQTPIPDGAVLQVHTSSIGPLSEGTYQLMLANAVAATDAGEAVEVEVSNGGVRVDLALPSSSLIAEGVLNSASLLPGAVARGELITLLGAGLGMADQVLFDGTPALVLFAGANQVNAVVPGGLSAERTRIELLRESVRIAEITVPVATAAPGIFTEDASGAGPAILTLEDGTRATAGNAARAGSVVTVYATGVGASETLAARIGTVEAEVSGMEALEGAPGIVQIRIRVPEELSGLALPLVVGTRPEGVRSQPGVTISVTK